MRLDQYAVRRRSVRRWTRFGAAVLVLGAVAAALAGCGSIGQTGQGASGPMQMSSRQAGSYQALTLTPAR
jgi:hypothetical protein